MLTNKDINTIKGLLYAASCTKTTGYPTTYREEFDKFLEEYFHCFPNIDEDNEPYQSPDFPLEE